MARFEIYVNNDDKGVAPFLIDVQSEFLSGLNTTVVVPLIRADSHPAGTRLPADLVPPFEVNGIRCVFYPPFIAAVSRSVLGERVGSLRNESSLLVSALDRLMGGF
ncbi:CcdB family protein [Cupriavidus pauculus]|uniref:Toxin CcdB n=1 Tax=Cupriavidus pauculus TaxID=82633 RepID=A0A2N5CBD3_9BURK|nr:CcdB family protein [Cupriavidus pauculus]PLP99481.1 cobalamin biosynthesis protein CbiX [Cupriavidus pauculus]